MPRHGIVVIDMLNDFVGEKAPLRCPGGEEIVPNLQKLFEWVRQRNAKAFFGLVYDDIIYLCKQVITLFSFKLDIIIYSWFCGFIPIYLIIGDIYLEIEI